MLQLGGVLRLVVMVEQVERAVVMWRFVVQSVRASCGRAQFHVQRRTDRVLPNAAVPAVMSNWLKMRWVHFCLAQEIWPAAGQISYRLYDCSNFVIGQTSGSMKAGYLTGYRLRKYVQIPNGAHRYRLRLCRCDGTTSILHRTAAGTAAAEQLTTSTLTNSVSRIRQSAN